MKRETRAIDRRAKPEAILNALLRITKAARAMRSLERAEGFTRAACDTASRLADELEELRAHVAEEFETFEEMDLWYEHDRKRRRGTA